MTVGLGHYLSVAAILFTIGTLGKKFKLVLTIHDMIYFTHRTPPQWLPWHIRLGWRLFHLTYWPMRWQLNKADIVATVSATARQALLDANQAVQRQEAKLDELREGAQAKLDVEYRRVELRVFLYRLALTLPLLAPLPVCNWP